ncbi:MAG: hypothetical protein AAGE84_25790 [Cyanobacteria bacterium P01_G01_bin.39]
MPNKTSNVIMEQLDNNTLILKVKPILAHRLMMFILGLIVLLFIVSLCAPYSINLTCDRYQSDITYNIKCQFLKRHLWGLINQKREIVASSYQLSIEEVYLGSSDTPNYDVILLADNEKIKITRFGKFTSDNNLWKKQSEQINKFIHRDDLHLEVGKDNSSIIFDYFSLMFMLAVIYIIILGTKINLNCILSKESNTLSIHRYNSLTRIVKEINFNEIEKLVVEENNDIEGSTSRIVFCLKFKENIPLTYWTDSYDGKDNIAKHINQFLS